MMTNTQPAHRTFAESASGDEPDDLCANQECDGLTDDGEGWNGYCGTCADRIEQQGGFD